MYFAVGILAIYLALSFAATIVASATKPQSPLNNAACKIGKIIVPNDPLWRYRG